MGQQILKFGSDEVGEKWEPGLKSVNNSPHLYTLIIYRVPSGTPCYIFFTVASSLFYKWEYSEWQFELIKVTQPANGGDGIGFEQYG